jgi:NAD(P)-dependent dehydrogenase (short-subunit alcohol dehydrogenase family)
MTEMGGSGAILQLTRCAALDAGKHGIRVNAVCPGPIMTEGTARHAASLGKTLDEVVAEMTGQMIIHRWETLRFLLPGKLLRAECTTGRSFDLQCLDHKAVAGLMIEQLSSFNSH